MYEINEKRLVKTFTDLARISSPSWKEDGVIQYIDKACRELKLKVKKFKCGESHNLLIRIPGSEKRKTVLFSGHTDTVEPCDNVKPVVLKDRITSDGNSILGSDDKSAIAIFLEGLRCIMETGMSHGPVELLLTCAEEVGLQGIKCFDLDQVEARYAFVFDSDGRVGKIIMKAPYHLTMNITIKGKAAHAGMEPEKGVNAISVLSEIITALPQGRLDGETTMNIGVIGGGRATNIVAEEAWTRLEIRSIDRNKMNDREKEIRNIIKETTSKRGARSKIEKNLEYTGFTIKETDPIIKLVTSSMEKIKIKPRFIVSGGGSDTNIFNRAGIKAVNLSCGMQKVHTTGEFILKKDLVNGTRLMLGIIDSVR